MDGRGVLARAHVLVQRQNDDGAHKTERLKLVLCHDVVGAHDVCVDQDDLRKKAFGGADCSGVIVDIPDDGQVGFGR